MTATRYITIAVLTAGLGAIPGMAQNRFEPDTNISCVERLQPPQYPVLAVQSRIEGTVGASVLLTPQGSIHEVKTEFISKTPTVTGALIQSVEQAVRGATFRQYCGGKTVTLVFDFKISGQPSENPKQSVAFGYPNKFWIVTEPGKSAPAESKSK